MELTSNLQPKQIKAAEYWLDSTSEEIMYGGAKGGAKSYLGCSLIFGDALTYPGTHYFIARHDLNDLTKYTTPSIYEVFEHWGIEPGDYMRFNGKDNYFNLFNDSRVYYIDCKHLPRDPDYHRFGSLQFTRGWCEEIGQIPDKAIQSLSASVGRWKNSNYNLKRKLLLTCNPNKGYAYKEFFIPHEENRLKPHRKFVKSLPSDNKYLTKEYIEALNRLPKDMRARLLFGDWRYDDDPTKLCDYDKILDVWSNDHIKEGPKYMTCDVARFGKDKSDFWVWSGMRVINIKVIPKASIPENVEEIKKLKTKYAVPMSNIIVDEGGVGGGVVDLLPGCKGYIGNAKPIPVSGRQNYENLRSQLYFVLAECINAGEMYIMTDFEKDLIIEEFEQIKKAKEVTEGKLSIIKKEKIKEILGRSPDHSDNAQMRMWFRLRRKTGMRRTN